MKSNKSILSFKGIRQIPQGYFCYPDTLLSVVGEDNIAALLENVPSDFEETDDEIESLSDLDHGNEKEDQGESTTEQESESEIQEKTGADVNPISLTENLDSGKDANNIYILPPHRQYACHTLNLICKYDIYKDLEPTLKNLMKATDNKVTAIWAKQNRSSKASDTIKDSLGMLFVIHNETRWNSYFNAKQRNCVFPSSRRGIRILIRQSDGSYIRSIGRSSSRRQHLYRLFTSYPYHPSQQDGKPEGERRHQALQTPPKPNDRISKKQSSSAADGIQSVDSDYSPQRKKAKKDFFKSILTTTVPAESNEVDLFLAGQSTKISSLNKYPTMKAIFIKYNAAFPSSAFVERLFSVAGRIFTPLRSRLSDKNFERMLLLKVNKCIDS
ncbi:Uncharacterized protein APZ42_025937 [Daphnia magna]|uniref:HAT C-terminal dimerisation domain-containing protein n=1 Tax=Daphnia magna TaxID=35525 RepID=A0A164SMJ7_9CRUS|nr:Uncharacterized protein APZ42_025937 [Daphnia magna]